MKEKERPFYLGIEGFEAGHSAAESLTNSAQTSACTTSDGREWRHEKTGLVISVINDHDTHSVENVQSDRLQIKNKGNKPVTISHFSRQVSMEIFRDCPRETVIHYFSSCWQSEFQYHSRSFEEMELVPVSVHPIVKSFSIESWGSYTTCRYIPFIAIENKRSGETLFLSFEPTSNWRIEVGVRGNCAYISAAEIDGRYLGTVKELSENETYGK